MQGVGESVTMSRSNHGGPMLDCCRRGNGDEVRSEQDLMVLEQQGTIGSSQGVNQTFGPRELANGKMMPGQFQAAM